MKPSHNRGVGPGAIHRAIVATQRQFWDPPQLDNGDRQRH
jgi:hypothetical protein